MWIHIRFHADPDLVGNVNASVADPVFGRNPDPGKYLELQRSNLKNDFNPGLRTLGGKSEESFDLKILVVQEEIRLFLQGSGFGSGRKNRIRIRQKSNFLLSY